MWFETLIRYDQNTRGMKGEVSYIQAEEYVTVCG